MKRRDFIKTTSLFSLGLISKTMHSDVLQNLNNFPDKNYLMSTIFIGHGSPMNAIEDNYFTRGWKNSVKNIPTPTAIVCISAHWETKGTKITAMEKPKMIYDMSGFPQKLYDVHYNSSGSPELANIITNKTQNPSFLPDTSWGYDHGAWSVLVQAFPEATIPCIQISLDYSRDFDYHYNLAKQLSFLRKKGVLIIGSGNIVHNLPQIFSTNNRPADWAFEFDETIAKAISNNDIKGVLNYKSLGRAGELSVNSAEHYLPLIYNLAIRNEKDNIQFFNHEDKSTLLGIGMRCVKIG